MHRARPRIHKKARPTSDIEHGYVIPELVIHKSLCDLPALLRRGDFIDNLYEEGMFSNLAKDDIDQCFHALQTSPLSVSLAFPVDRMQLPMITIMKESMVESASMLGDFAGMDDQEIYATETETILTPDGGATGGETSFYLPCTGELISNSVQPLIRRSGEDWYLDRDNSEFSVNSLTRIISLTAPLLAGDIFVISRFAAYGMDGGTVYANIFDYTGVIFIETENPVLTTFLSTLVWHKTHQDFLMFVEAGFTDISFSFRAFSLWEQMHPAIAHRAEVTVTGYITWTVRSDEIAPKGTTEVELSDASTGEIALEFSANPYEWDAED